MVPDYSNGTVYIVNLHVIA